MCVVFEAEPESKPQALPDFVVCSTNVSELERFCAALALLRLEQGDPIELSEKQAKFLCEGTKHEAEARPKRVDRNVTRERPRNPPQGRGRQDAAPKV